MQGRFNLLIITLFCHISASNRIVCDHMYQRGDLTQGIGSIGPQLSYNWENEVPQTLIPLLVCLYVSTLYILSFMLILFMHICHVSYTNHLLITNTVCWSPECLALRIRNGKLKSSLIPRELSPSQPFLRIVDL